MKGSIEESSKKRFLKQTNRDFIKELFAKQPTERKKKKLITSIAKKERKKIEPSKIQNFISMLMKKKEIDKDKIIGLAATNNYTISSDEAKLFADIVKCKVTTREIKLPSNICTKEFYGYKIIHYKKFSYVTDDYLFMNALFSINFNNQDSILGELGSVEEISFVNGEIMKKFPYYTGFFEDQTRFGSMIKSPYVSNTEILEIIDQFINKKNVERIQKLVKAYEFKLNSLTYYLIEIKGHYSDKHFNFTSDDKDTACMIVCPKDYTYDKIKRFIDNTKTIESKLKLTKGLKEIKKGKNFFINAVNEKLVNFCSSVIIASEPTDTITDVTVLGKFRLDHLKLFKKLLSDIEGKTGSIYVNTAFTIPNSTVTFENYQSFIEMLVVLTCLEDNIPNILRIDIVETYGLYVEARPFMEYVKRLYNEFKYIVLYFYDSFVTKINYDKLTKLKLKIEPLMIQLKDIQKNLDAYDSIKKFISRIEPYCITIKNFILGIYAMTVLKAIHVAITNLDFKNKEKKGLEESFRVAGVCCLQVMVEGDYPMIPEIRSQCAFLGDVGGALVTSDNLDARINELIEKRDNYILSVEEMRAEEDKRLDSISIAASEINNAIDQILANDLKKMFKGYYTDDEVKQISDFVKKSKNMGPVVYKDITEALKIEEGNAKEVIESYSILNFDEFKLRPIYLDFINQLIAVDKEIKNLEDREVKNKYDPNLLINEENHPDDHINFNQISENMRKTVTPKYMVEEINKHRKALNSEGGLFSNLYPEIEKEELEENVMKVEK